MMIGLTYDLRSDYLQEGYSEEETAEFDRESTIDAIETTLNHLGYQTDRIGHVRHLTSRLVKGDRWDLVFNISEGMYGIGREAQVPTLLDAYRIPYTFSDALVLSLTLHKGMTKRVMRDGGVATPDFYIVECDEDITLVALQYPLFVKPCSEGTGKGINALSRVNSREELLSICHDLLKRYPSGLLVEEYLPGREFTVGILGSGKEGYAVGLMEIVYKKEDTNNIYSYETKSDYLKAVEYRIPEEDISRKCIDLALRSWR